MLMIISSPVLADSIVVGYVPYTEPSISNVIRVAYLDNSSDRILNATVNFELDSVNYTMSYNESTSAYESTVVFNPADLGDWNFTIYANKTGQEDETYDGTIKVRTPIFINVRLFEDTNSTPYEDEYAQVVAEGNYSCYPLITKTETDVFGEVTYSTDCYFHADYSSGLAQIRAYEYGSYEIRFISASNFVYTSSFASPTIERQNYAFNLGTFTVSENPTNVNIVMTSCELNPEQCARYYQSLFLWIFFLVISSVLGIVAGKYSDNGGVAIATGIVTMIGLILLRFAILGY